MLINKYLRNITNKKSIISKKINNKIVVQSYNQLVTGKEIDIFSSIIKNFLINIVFNNLQANYLLLNSLMKNKNNNNYYNNYYYFSFIRYFFFSSNLHNIQFNLTNSDNSSVDLNKVLFYKWLLVETHSSYFFNLFNLPKKIIKYTLLRSPFVFKKGREEFQQNHFKSVISYSSLLDKSLFSIYLKHNSKNNIIKHKYYKKFQ